MDKNSKTNFLLCDIHSATYDESFRVKMSGFNLHNSLTVGLSVTPLSPHGIWLAQATQAAVEVRKFVSARGYNRLRHLERKLNFESYGAHCFAAHLPLLY